MILKKARSWVSHSPLLSVASCILAVSAVATYALLPGKLLATQYANALQAHDEQSLSEEMRLFLTAIQTNNIQVINSLVAEGFDMNKPDNGDGTALIIAIKRQNIDMVQQLLAFGAKPDAVSQNDGSPLIAATVSNNMRLVQMLLDQGANPNLYVSGDETPLIQAVRSKNFAVVSLLVKYGAKIDLAVDDDGKTISALQIASTKEITQYLQNQLTHQHQILAKYKNVIEHAEAEVARMKAEYQLPSISIAVNVENEVIWQHTLGFADIENQTKATPNTSYAVGSIAKPITTLAMGRLLSQNRQLLDNPIETYSSYPKTVSALTPLQLASHTAGIIHYNDKRHVREFEQIKDHKHPAEALDIFIDEPLSFTPGENFKYSSSGYILLSDVLAKSSGMDYLSLLQTQVFEPLNMTRTELDDSSISKSREASYYQVDADTNQIIPAQARRDRSFLFGGGGFVSTPTDLVNMASGMMQKDYLSLSTFDLLTTPVRLKNGSMNPQNYALGWRVNHIDESYLQDETALPTKNENSDNRKIFGVHHGGTVADAASAYLLMFPESKVSISFTTNIIPSNQTREDNIRTNMWKLLYRFHNIAQIKK